jgi:glycosyltransferase involved in cell wall biosynthesis
MARWDARVTTSPKVSVIVPHYSDLAALDQCLDLLVRQNFPKADFEIIVADNASPQGEAAVAAAIAGRARLVIVPEKGAGPARNGGVAASSGAVLAFIDCDCLPDPQWLAAGVAALERYDFVGGAVEVMVADEGDLTQAEAFERVFAFHNKDYVERKGFTVTANLFCRRALFDDVGGFRTGVSEDLDWSHRARAAGYSLGYEPAAMVGHPARRTWDDLIKKWRRLNLESYGLVAGTAAGRQRWVVKSLALPLSAVAHTPRVLFDPGLSSMRHRWLALSALYRLRLWRCGDALALVGGARRG